MNQIICICGKKGSGKTTLATALKKRLTGNWEILSLAEPLKRLCAYALGNSYVSVTEDEKNLTTRFGMTLRELYQRTGDAMRGVHPEFWIRVWETRAESLRKLHPQQGLSFIVDDLRYTNEYDYFAAKNAILVRLQRNPYSGDLHISEAQMDYLTPSQFHITVPADQSAAQARDLVLAHADLRDLVK